MVESANKYDIKITTPKATTPKRVFFNAFGFLATPKTDAITAIATVAISNPSEKLQLVKMHLK